jgi:quercetin dioxygenase-like cupin family protein
LLRCVSHAGHTTKIEGGTSRHVVPGDVIITPGRTPHLWGHIESDMQSLVIRPDPDSTLPLK